MMQPPKPPGRRRWVACSLIAAVLVGVGAWAVWYFFILPDDPVPGIEKMLDENGPRLGATREEVEAWLGRQGIPHDRRSLNSTGGYPAQRAPSEFGDLAPSVAGDYILGYINAPYRLTWGRMVFIYFFFDDHDRLIQHVVRAWDGYF